MPLLDTLRESGTRNVAPYIFHGTQRESISSTLNKTVAKVDEAAETLKQIAKSGKKVLFVATKKNKQVAEKAASVNMPICNRAFGRVVC